MPLYNIALATILDEFFPCLTYKEIISMVLLSKKHRSNFKTLIFSYCLQHITLKIIKSKYRINTREIQIDKSYEEYVHGTNTREIQMDKRYEEYINKIDVIDFNITNTIFPKNIKMLITNWFDIDFNILNRFTKLTTLNIFINRKKQLDYLPTTLTNLRLNIYINEENEVADLRELKNLRNLEIDAPNGGYEIFLPPSIDRFHVFTYNTTFHGRLNLVLYKQEHNGKQNNVYCDACYIKHVIYRGIKEIDMKILNNDVTYEMDGAQL